MFTHSRSLAAGLLVTLAVWSTATPVQAGPPHPPRPSQVPRMLPPINTSSTSGLRPSLGTLGGLGNAFNQGGYTQPGYQGGYNSQPGYQGGYSTQPGYQGGYTSQPGYQGGYTQPGYQGSYYQQPAYQQPTSYQRGYSQQTFSGPISGQRYQIPAQYAGTPPGYVITYSGYRYLTGNDGTMTTYTGPVSR